VADSASKRAAVLGHPIAHSLSPVLHRAAYEALGLNWTYERVDITGDNLADFMAGLDETWAGLSLTMPLKRDVLALLDHADPLVSATGAANTVVLTNGRRYGFNTDVDGLVRALAEHSDSRPIHTAAVLGGGATARSAIAALARGGVSSATAYVRRPEAGEELLLTAEALSFPLSIDLWTNAAGGLDADLVLSTTPVGASDPLAAWVPRTPGLLLDVVYDPWPTVLAAAWTGAGGRVASGLDLLLHQAVLQVGLMTGFDAPLEIMRAALERAARSR